MLQITFFAAGSKIAEKWAQKASKKTIVIDNSKFFRMDKDVPLVVPEVNPDQLAMYKKKNIIANANCSTIQMVVVLKPLHDHFTISKELLYRRINQYLVQGKLQWMNLITQSKDFLDGKKFLQKFYKTNCF